MNLKNITTQFYLVELIQINIICVFLYTIICSVFRYKISMNDIFQDIDRVAERTVRKNGEEDDIANEIQDTDLTTIFKVSYERESINIIPTIFLIINNALIVGIIFGKMYIEFFRCIINILLNFILQENLSRIINKTIQLFLLIIKTNFLLSCLFFIHYLGSLMYLRYF